VNKNLARLATLTVVLALAAISSLSLASPAYTSPNFEVYNNAGAGVEYAESVANALENARSTLLQKGAALAPLFRQPLHRVRGEAGRRRWAGSVAVHV